MVNKTLHRKLKIEENSTKIGGKLECSIRVSGSCSSFTVKQQKHQLIWKSCWTPEYINTNNIYKPPTKQMDVKTNQTSFYVDIAKCEDVLLDKINKTNPTKN